MPGAFAGNVTKAADLGGIGAAPNLLLPVPIPAIVTAAGMVILLFHHVGSCALLRSIFRWPALALLAVLRGTVEPQVRLDADFLSLIVACIGSSLSAYIFTWQSDQEVEERPGHGHTEPWQRKGAADAELARTRCDVMVGTLFSNLILYLVILSTGATLHAGHTAADAAAALEPLAVRRRSCCSRSASAASASWPCR